MTRPSVCDHCRFNQNDPYTCKAPTISNRYCNHMLQWILNLGLVIGFFFSIIGWQLPDSRYTLAQVYKICNNTVYTCDNIQCNSTCRLTFGNNQTPQSNNMNYILMVLCIYWICFIVGLLMTLASALEDAGNGILRCMRMYYAFIIPTNTICHFIGAAFLYIANPKVYDVMPIISLYTLYIGFPIVLACTLVIVLITLCSISLYRHCHPPQNNYESFIFP